MTAFRYLLEELLEHLDYYDTEGVALAYHLYQNICKGTLSLEEVLESHAPKEKKEIEAAFEIPAEDYCRIESQEELAAIENERMEPAEKEKKGVFRRVLEFFLKKEPTEPEEKVITFKEDYFKENYQNPFSGEETIMAFTEEKTESGTILLNQMSHGKWELRPLMSEYEKFYIDKSPFLIGKRRGAVDGVIPRETVSRIHSRLFLEDHRLYISDANSTNGTLVNGVAIEAGKQVEIFPGDRILFADVGYECYNSL